MTTTIYHNPRCTKSRLTLQLLKDQEIVPVVVEYLKTPPSAEVLKELLKMLGMTPRDLMRKNESVYKEENLGRADLDDKTLIEFMVNHPILIERPIVVHNGKAAIGRPPESVLKIL